MDKIIDKLKNKIPLSYIELYKVFNGYLENKLSDSEMTTVLKLICKNSLTDKEVFDLTDIFINSGEVLEKNDDFIDKHSTGGVGDKTTLILLPILASLGVSVSKMSGRGLGHTGGTIDKLESIGVKTSFTNEEFEDAIEKFKMVISSQTSNLCPMDKKVYALRDVTNTTMSIPLIASSIMSKKIASGAGKILLDIKVGKGALIENLEDAKHLASLMIKIGHKYDRKVVCMLTDMDNPLGDNIGNKIEILEVIDILKNKKRNKLTYLVIEMASIMMHMQNKTDLNENRRKVVEVLTNGEAYKKFHDYVTYYGGSLDISIPSFVNLYSKETGYIHNIDSLKIGELSMNCGAGRKNKEDKIDYNAGIILVKNKGDFVYEDDLLAMISSSKETSFESFYDALTLKIEKDKKKDIIFEVCGDIKQ